MQNLDKLESTNSLKSCSFRFDETLNTLLIIIGKNTERRFLKGLALGVNAFFLLYYLGSHHSF